MTGSEVCCRFEFKIEVNLGAMVSFLYCMYFVYSLLFMTLNLFTHLFKVTFMLQTHLEFGSPL